MAQKWGQFNSEIEGQFQFWNQNDLLKNMELINLEMELKFATEKLNP